MQEVAEKNVGGCNTVFQPPRKGQHQSLTAPESDLLKIHCRHTLQVLSLLCCDKQTTKRKGVMTTMDQIHRIRKLYYGQDKSLTEIARLLHMD